MVKAQGLLGLAQSPISQPWCVNGEHGAFLSGARKGLGPDTLNSIFTAIPNLDLGMWGVSRPPHPRGPGVTQPHMPAATCACNPALLITGCPSCAWASAMFPYIPPGVHPLKPPPMLPPLPWRSLIQSLMASGHMKQEPG